MSVAMGAALCARAVRAAAALWRNSVSEMGGGRGSEGVCGRLMRAVGVR